MTECKSRPDEEIVGAAQEAGSEAEPHSRVDERDEPLDAVITFLDTLFDGGAGYLSVALGRQPDVSETGSYRTQLAQNQQTYQWPSDGETAIAMLLEADCDVFVCPYLLEGEKRRKGTSVAEHRRHIHADIDLPDNSELDLDVVRAIPGSIAVASGSPGNGHVYVLLTEPISLGHHEKLCRALGAYLGTNDASKVSDNDLLRPPGTLNFKPTVMGGGGRPPSPVHWLVKPKGERISPSDLAAILGIELADVPVQTVDSTASPFIDTATVEVQNLNLTYPKVYAALQRATNDRSADTMRIVSACRAGGLRLAETRSVVMSRADLAERLDNRHDDDVARCWDRSEHVSAQGHDAEAEVSSYTDVGLMLDGSLPESPRPDVLTRTDGAALFYRGEVNVVFGDPEHGKTWVVLAACVEVLRRSGGRVLVVDLDHNGASAIIHRLLMMDAPVEALRDVNRFRHCQPADAAHFRRVVEDCKRWQADAVVIDSTGELLPMFTANSDSADDYTRVHNDVLQPLASTGAAVLLVDHLGKSPAARHYGPGGSMAKRRTIGGTSIRVVRKRAFNPDEGGSAELWVNKDRHGGVRQNCMPAQPGKDEQLVGTFVLADDRAGTANWQVSPGKSHVGSSSDPRDFRPTALMERASRMLEEQSGELTKNKLAAAAGGRKMTTLRAVDILQEEGYVGTEKRGRFAFCVSIKPYRQRNDEASDEFKARVGLQRELTDEHAHGVVMVDDAQT